MGKTSEERANDAQWAVGDAIHELAKSGLAIADAIVGAGNNIASALADIARTLHNAEQSGWGGQ